MPSRTTRPARPGAGKYKNVRTVYDGLTYDSKAEAAYAARLDLELKAGAIRGWIRQPTFRLGVPENVYRPDFLVFEINGNVTAVDVKGKRTPKFERDCRLWARYAPCVLQIVSGKHVETIFPECLKTGLIQGVSG